MRPPTHGVVFPQRLVAMAYKSTRRNSTSAHGDSARVLATKSHGKFSHSNRWAAAIAHENPRRFLTKNLRLQFTRACGKIPRWEVAFWVKVGNPWSLENLLEKYPSIDHTMLFSIHCFESAQLAINNSKLKSSFQWRSVGQSGSFQTHFYYSIFEPRLQKMVVFYTDWSPTDFYLQMKERNRILYKWDKIYKYFY